MRSFRVASADIAEAEASPKPLLSGTSTSPNISFAKHQLRQTSTSPSISVAKHRCHRRFAA